MIRSDRVEELVEQALQGMERVEGGFSGAELLSAVFTVTLRAMKSTLKKNPECVGTITQSVWGPSPKR